MEQVRDPVCGMIIDRETAKAQMTYEGREVYFCSHECRRAFQADPGRYAGAEPERHEPPYTVSHHVTAPKFGSAGSGGLEDEPGPERHRD
ncbi:MAG TPA: YHS domain-containing protein [Gemmatimonadales bacterium]|nr:YHS domain-containing protein [Gemmatimonadales bacterium]